MLAFIRKKGDSLPVLLPLFKSRYPHNFKYGILSGYRPRKTQTNRPRSPLFLMQSLKYISAAFLVYNQSGVCITTVQKSCSLSRFLKLPVAGEMLLAVGVGKKIGKRPALAWGVFVYVHSRAPSSLLSRYNSRRLMVVGQSSLPTKHYGSFIGKRTVYLFL